MYIQDNKSENESSDGIMMNHTNQPNCKPDKGKWLIDTGATYHSTPNLEDYMHYHLWPESSHRKIRIGDSSVLSVKGIGSVTIKH
jgi:hypothetical protein